MDSHGAATFDPAQAQRLVEQFKMERGEQLVVTIANSPTVRRRHGPVLHVTLLEMSQQEWNKWREQ